MPLPNGLIRTIAAEVMPAPTRRELPVVVRADLRARTEKLRAYFQLTVDGMRQRAHERRYRPPQPHAPLMLVIIPAHNEDDVIDQCIEALLKQTRRPDAIVVAADNCVDATTVVASRYLGVTVFETVRNAERKAGALTQAWRKYATGYDLIVCVDADTVLDRQCLELLEEELAGHPPVGGVMARYTFDQRQASGLFARLLVRLQRFEFAGWTVDILHRRRRTYVLGGQATMFRAEALRDVTNVKHRGTPWNSEAQVEDMELTWALHAAGWETKISSTARAYVGPMLTLRSFWAQRRKWDDGLGRLLLMSGVNRTTLYPWRMQAKMFLDLSIRALFVVLTILSVVNGSYRWYWIWAIPPAIAILLNLRTVRRMPDRTFADVVFAITLVPIELYLWFRLFVWTTSWMTVLSGSRRDGWARQYEAERKVSALVAA